MSLGLGEPSELQELDREFARFQVPIARVDHIGVSLQLDQSDDPPVMSVGVVGIDFQGGLAGRESLRILLVEDQDVALLGKVFRQLAAAGEAVADDLVQIVECGLAGSGAQVFSFQDPEGASPVQRSRVRLKSDRPAKFLEGLTPACAGGDRPGARVT